MKIRSGFVSNSSSSSFVIATSGLFGYPYNSLNEDIGEQEKAKYEEAIENWKERGLVRKNYLAIYSRSEADNLINTILEANENSCQPWRIEQYRDFLICSTTMTNFDLKEFIENLTGRELEFIFDFPSYCGFDHWHYSIRRMKKLINIAFPKETQK